MLINIVELAVFFVGYIIGNNRNQMTLFPETIEEYISENNPVRVIDAFVENINLVEAEFNNTTPSKEGRPRYSPKTLLKLYIYGYFNKIRTSRKLMAECERNIEVMWLLGKLTPDFRTIADFRKDNAKALKKTFRAFVKMCMELDLYTKELVAIDGSKFRAVNSKDNNVTLSKLEDKIKRIEENINEYLQELDKYDKNEIDTKELTKEELQQKLDILKQRKDIYDGYLKDMKENKETQISFVDPESRLMRTHSGGFDVSYNVQTAVDAGNHMIVDFEVTNNCNDSGLLCDGAKRVKEILETDVLEVAADNGYESTEDMLKCLKAGVMPNVALKNGAKEHEITLDYKEADITVEMLDSMDPEDIQRCLEAGVLPTVYADKDIKIEIIEEVKNGPSEKYFILSDDGKSVICPEGNTLNKSAELKNKPATRFVSRSACSSCKNKCTTSKFKQVDLKDGQKVLYLKESSFVKRTVKIKLKPDKEKIKKRKCIVEHPFGTVKRWCDASYVLMKSKAKATGDLALSFLAYNMKRAIKIVGVTKLIEQMA
jgi:transposase